MNTLRRGAFVLWLVLLAMTVLAVNKIFWRDLPDDLLEQAERLEDAGLSEQAEECYERLLDENPLDLDLHYQYLLNHFEITRIGEGSSDNQKVIERYQRLTEQADSADIGFYGLGLIESHQKRYRQALPYLASVQNRDQKYLNNSLGRIYFQLNDFPQAEVFFQREIEMGGNLEGAVTNLANLYMRQGNIAGLKELSADQHTAEHLSINAQGYLALRTGRLLHYLFLIFVKPFTQVSLGAALCALLICGGLVLFFLQVEAFKQEPRHRVFLVVLAGALASLLALVLYDLWFWFQPIGIGHHWNEDLIYCLLHVGVIEEIAKILPALILFRLIRKQTYPPIVLVLYASLSALGFASLENSLYFSVLGPRVILLRFLFSTLMHMGETGLIIYVTIIAHKQHRSRAWIFAFLGLTAAVITHGLFDYFILVDIDALAPISLVMALTMIMLYRWALDDCLRLAPPQESTQSGTTPHLGNYRLLFALSVTLLTVSYVSNNFRYTTPVADTLLIQSYSVGLIYIAFIFGVPRFYHWLDKRFPRRRQPHQPESSSIQPPED